MGGDDDIGAPPPHVEMKCNVIRGKDGHVSGFSFEIAFEERTEDTKRRRIMPSTDVTRIVQPPLGGATGKAGNHFGKVASMGCMAQAYVKK